LQGMRRLFLAHQSDFIGIAGRGLGGESNRIKPNQSDFRGFDG
jgi:hypothetical protein